MQLLGIIISLLGGGVLSLLVGRQSASASRWLSLVSLLDLVNFGIKKVVSNMLIKSSVKLLIRSHPGLSTCSPWTTGLASGGSLSNCIPTFFYW